LWNRFCWSLFNRPAMMFSETTYLCGTKYSTHHGRRLRFRRSIWKTVGLCRPKPRNSWRSITKLFASSANSRFSLPVPYWAVMSAYPVRQVRPAPAAQSSERRLPARRHRPRCIDARRLVGAAAATLMPLVDVIRDQVFAAERIHADDTTVPVLQGQDADQPALDLCARRPPVRRARSAGGRVLLFA
jgi:Transposase IS66 family